MKNTKEPSWIPQGLIDSAKNRTASVVLRLQRAMNEMEKDVQNNDGLYPFNRGRIDQSEVCRRAGVSKVTLQGPSHKTTTKKQVDTWVASMKAQAVVGAQGVRRKVTERADHWKTAHSAIANHYHLAELELVDAQQEIRRLTEENRAIKAQLAKAGNVTLLPRKR